MKEIFSTSCASTLSPKDFIVVRRKTKRKVSNIMSLEHPSCQEEEDYIRENYSEQASWCDGEPEELEEASEQQPTNAE